MKTFFLRTFVNMRKEWCFEKHSWMHCNTWKTTRWTDHTGSKTVPKMLINRLTATERKRLLESHDALSQTLTLRHFIAESEENIVGQFIKCLNQMKPWGVGNLLKESWSQQILTRLEFGSIKVDKILVKINIKSWFIIFFQKKKNTILYNQEWRRQDLIVACTKNT